MSLLTVLLSIILVLNAVFLILLILIQLPKKEAGAGLAFGAGATDALFGAGSGNALTKVTKYTAAIFLVLVLTLSTLGQRIAHQGSKSLEQELKRRANLPAALPAPTTPKPITIPAAPSTNNNSATTNGSTVTLTNSNLLKTTLPTNAATPAPATTPPPAPTTPPAAPQK